MRYALCPLMLALSMASCGKRGAPPQGATSDASMSPIASTLDASPSLARLACAPDPAFPAMLDVPEASAATEVELVPGRRELLVTSDSSRKGAALAYALPSGPARALRLPLDPRVSDDTEGVAWRGGRLYVLISTGFVERFAPDGDGGLVRDGDTYALGAPPYVASSPKPTSAIPPDFEGLCLRPGPPTAPARCAGYAASRAYGWLVCLVFDGDRLRVDPARPRLALDVPKHSLSDCAFGAAGGPAAATLLVTTNIRGGSNVYRVDEDTGALAALDVETTLNDEAVAVDRDGRLYQLADAQSERSPALRATCTGW